MLLVPKIYIKDTKTLMRGDARSSLFTDDPFATAKAMMDIGTDAIYVMDLNISPVGTNPNTEIIKKIRNDLKLKVILGGAFRVPQCFTPYEDADLELFVFDSNAYQQPKVVEEACKKFPGKIAVNIDVREERVVIPGWTVAANKTAYDYVERFTEQGVESFFYSNMNAEGKTQESNLEELKNFCKKIKKPVYCTNEINTLEDIVSLVTLGAPHLEAVILDKGLYQERIDLKGANAYVADLMLDSSNEPTLQDM